MEAEGEPTPHKIGGLSNDASSRSCVPGGAQTENEFGAF